MGPTATQVRQQRLALAGQREIRLEPGPGMSHTEQNQPASRVVQLQVRDLAVAQAVGREQPQNGVVTQALGRAIALSRRQDGINRLRTQRRRDRGKGVECGRHHAGREIAHRPRFAMHQSASSGDVQTRLCVRCVAATRRAPGNRHRYRRPEAARGSPAVVCAAYHQESSGFGGPESPIVVAASPRSCANHCVYSPHSTPAKISNRLDAHREEGLARHAFAGMRECPSMGDTPSVHGGRRGDGADEIGAARTTQVPLNVRRLRRDAVGVCSRAESEESDRRRRVPCDDGGPVSSRGQMPLEIGRAGRAAAGMLRRGSSPWWVKRQPRMALGSIPSRREGDTALGSASRSFLPTLWDLLINQLCGPRQS